MDREALRIIRSHMKRPGDRVEVPIYTRRGVDDAIKAGLDPAVCMPLPLQMEIITYVADENMDVRYESLRVVQ